MKHISVPGIAAIKKTLELQHEAFGQPQRKRGKLAKFFGVSPLAEDAVQWFRGVTGEQMTGRELEKLGEEYLVLHGVPVGSGESDIDHVVIGPTGVFTVNTKYHPNSKVWVSEKTVMVNGQRQPYLRNSKFEAQRAGKLLSSVVGSEVNVQAALSFISEKLTVKSLPQGIAAVTPKELARLIRKSPVEYSEVQLIRLKEAAVQPSTWHTNPAELDSDTLLAEFNELKKAVNGSKVVKLVWLILPAPVVLFLLWQAMMFGVNILFEPSIG